MQVFKRLLLLFIIPVLLLLFMPLVPAEASDVSQAQWVGLITVTNNSSIPATDVTVAVSVNTTAMITQGFTDSSFSNCAIKDSSGADIPFMPVYGADLIYLFAGDFGVYEVKTFNFYTGNVTGGKIKYFPGSTGMSVSDNANLEIGSNGTVELTDTFIDTTAGFDNILFNKIGAIYCGNSANVSGTVKAALGLRDNFKTDSWTDVGTKISVDTTTQKLNYESEKSATDNRCYLDLTSISDTSWSLDFTFSNNTSVTGGAFYFGAFSTAANWNGYAGDAIGVVLYCSAAPTTGIYIVRKDAGTADTSSSINVINGSIYYANLTRNTVLATLSVYSDAARTTPVAGSPITLAIPATVTGLRYIQGTNENSGAGEGTEVIGWVDNVEIDRLAVNLTGITTNEYDTVVTLNSTNMSLTIGASTANVALGAYTVPNNASSWLFGSDATLYIGQMKITVGGNTRGQWERQYSSTFADLSGNGNTGTPSFRTTSSDPDVTASLTSFSAVSEARALSSIAGGSYPWTAAPSRPSNLTVPSEGVNIFFYNFLHSFFMGNSDMEKLFWFITSLLIVLVGGYLAQRYAKSIVIKACLMGVLILGGALSNVYGLWMLIVYICYAFGIIIMSRHFGF